MGFQALLVLLVHVDSRMGPITIRWNEVLDSLSKNNRIGVIVVCVVVVSSFIVAFVITLLISRPMDRLVNAMMALAMLVLSSASTFITFKSLLQEVSACEVSYLSMQRAHDYTNIDVYVTCKL